MYLSKRTISKFGICLKWPLCAEMGLLRYLSDRRGRILYYRNTTTLGFPGSWPFARRKKRSDADSHTNTLELRKQNSLNVIITSIKYFSNLSTFGIIFLQHRRPHKSDFIRTKKTNKATSWVMKRCREMILNATGWQNTSVFGCSQALKCLLAESLTPWHRFPIL